MTSGSSLACPRVTVIMPIRNEANYIEHSLGAILTQDFPPDCYEVIVVDGLSTDGTREIVRRMMSGPVRVRLLDNPGRITPIALNIGIREAEGDIIVRVDGHAGITPNYVSQCVSYLQKTRADNVGGLWHIVPRTDGLVGRAIAASLSHPFGTGNARYKTGETKPRWVDTVPFGCYRRQVFDEIGGFDENLTRSQDMEFNLRLRRSGGKTLLVPSIVSTYYARTAIWESIKHHFNNGIWAIFPLNYGRLAITWRHAAPLAFTLALLGTALLGLLEPPLSWLLVLMVASYLTANLAASVSAAVGQRDGSLLLVLPLIFASMHMSYGLGSICGLIKVVISSYFWLTGIHQLLTSLSSPKHTKSRKRANL